MQLNVAAFAMDRAALKYLLYDIGVPVDCQQTADAERTALHLVSMTVNKLLSNLCNTVDFACC